MADPLSGFGNTYAGIKGSLGTATTASMYAVTVIIVLGILIAVIYHVRKLRSFNHVVIIRRPIGESNGFEMDLGYRGRYFWATSLQNEKEMRFEIMNAQKFKLNYNNEPVDRKYRIPIVTKGKRGYMIIMQPDQEGFLHPVLLTQSDRSELVTVIGQADISYAIKEVENYAQKYLDEPDFFKKYGMLIYFLLLLVIAALYWWGTRNNGQAMMKVAEAIQQLAAAVPATGVTNGNVTAPVAVIVG